MENEMTIYEKLLKIQIELKAPKNQRNNFGNYNYRSCEDILEAVKPLLEKNECTLTISDEVIANGDRIHIIASVILRGISGTEFISTKGYAREADVKKGMDPAQITGAASSYARKYALNGLFLIDDTKDADTDDGKKEIIELEKHEAKINKIDDIDTLKEYYMKYKGLGKGFTALITVRKKELTPKKDENS